MLVWKLKIFCYKLENSIENEKRSAMNEIKNQVADLSIDIASKVLEQELDTNKNHQEYINKLLKEKI